MKSSAASWLLRCRSPTTFPSEGISKTSPMSSFLNASLLLPPMSRNVDDSSTWLSSHTKNDLFVLGISGNSRNPLNPVDRTSSLFLSSNCEIT
uniref:Uncharacterized protein n=1 Tax=Arundo donax TaxID=35708 RepID=A0A0A9BSV3_ARUDO